MPAPEFSHRQGALVIRFIKQKRVGKEINTAQLIVNEITENPKVTIPELAHKLLVTERTVERIIKLKQQNKLKRIGGRKRGYWEIIL